ncbi:MAG: DUF72 domain-containing protein [Dehalococcoidia bacterium]|nr:DUF72 domain-containing protein [Dehalococcoidia bacterium]
MGTILVGTSSWTDPTLIESGRFYPPQAKTAEARLRYYAGVFKLVEVDSAYYAPPAESTARLWVERTPQDFLFDIKAFRLFTHHPTPVKALPADLRQALPGTAEKGSVYQRDIPAEITDEVWRRFEQALLPLDSAMKLGVVMLQFPPWFCPGSEQERYILSCKQRLPQYRVAVEFRHSSWFNEKNRHRTFDFLRANALPYVCVDEPQGFNSSVPPLVEATSDIGVVRFHGRNAGAWEKKDIGPAERFNYLYSEQELQEWAAKIRELAGNTAQTHVLFNNCYQDRAVSNARQIALMLE